MAEAAVRQGRPLPNRIQNSPQLHLGLTLFFIGFLDLTDEREIGLVHGPIPWRAIREYCLDHEIVDEQKEDFFFHIKRLDMSYLKWKQEQKDGNGKS